MCTQPRQGTKTWFLIRARVCTVLIRRPCSSDAPVQVAQALVLPLELRQAYLVAPAPPPSPPSPQQCPCSPLPTPAAPAPPCSLSEQQGQAPVVAAPASPSLFASACERAARGARGRGEIRVIGDACPSPGPVAGPRAGLHRRRGRPGEGEEGRRGAPCRVRSPPNPAPACCWGTPHRQQGPVSGGGIVQPGTLSFCQQPKLNNASTPCCLR